MQQFSHSYPPCFRHQFSDQLTDELSGNDNHHTHEQDPLPSIDLHQLNLKKLEEACTDWGIFRLVNHGIPSGLLSELYEHAARMFGLEFESKQKLFESVPLSAMSYFWGTPAVTPAGVPLALCKEKGIVNYNWVEGLNIPLSQPSKVDLVHQPLLRDFRLVSLFILIY
ncbi:putative gibberellin 2-beta-dioxygenase [Helianthus debilis subsp. tardiflorus]